MSDINLITDNESLEYARLQVEIKGLRDRVRRITEQRDGLLTGLDQKDGDIERLRLENSQWQSACAGYTEALAARDRDNAALRTALQNARIELKRMKEYYEPDPGSED